MLFLQQMYNKKRNKKALKAPGRRKADDLCLENVRFAFFANA